MSCIVRRVSFTPTRLLLARLGVARQVSAFLGRMTRRHWLFCRSVGSLSVVGELSRWAGQAIDSETAPAGDPSGPRLRDPPGPIRDRHRSSRGRSAGRARGAPLCQTCHIGGSLARPAVRGTAPRNYAQVARRCGRGPQKFAEQKVEIM